MKWIERDVIIVGGGPAGSICASYLAKAGVDVLLLDRDVFPRDKVCGDMITENVANHAARLEAADKLDKMSVFINQLLMVSSSGNEALVPFECYGTKRRDFDQLMLETAISWGAEFRPGCMVTGLVRERGSICGVKVRHGGVESELRCKLVIGADGAFSLTAKEAGLMREHPSAMSIGCSAYFEGVRFDRNIAIGQYSAYGTVFFDELVAPGYIWVFPSGDGGVLRGHCNVGMIVDYADGARAGHDDLEERFRKWLAGSTRASSLLGSAVQVSPWRRGKLTYLTQNMEKAADGLLLIGDAASVMQPLRGDGLSAAADSARAAADTAWEAIKENDFSAKFLRSTYAKNPIHMAPGALRDRLKHRRLIRETLFDAASVDRAIDTIRKDKSVGERLLQD